MKKSVDNKEYPVREPGEVDRRGRGDYVDLPDGSHIAPNGAVIKEPLSDKDEVLPPNEYTPDKDDLDLLIM